jgi:alkylation response protein AidB-like acyl-CoA dehydrogenase
MDFAFTEEQEMVRELAREVLEKEATAERVKEAAATPDWIDEGLWWKLGETNLLGIAVPEEHGGMGLGFLELCVLLEEVGRSAAPLPVLESLVLGGLLLARFGTEEQKRAWLPRIASGKAVLTAGLQDAGSEEGTAPATRARREASGFRLSGAKRLVPFARRADRILVAAGLPDEGVGLFLVDPRSDGVVLEGQVTSTGEPLFQVTLSSVLVADADRIGGPAADGAAILAWLLDRALVGLAALQTGVSDRALEITAGYARERVQFGVPIGSFQAVQHRCADAFIDLEALRWCTWRAAWRCAAELPAAREAAVAKFWAADAGSRIANASIHLHGGLGSDVDYPIERYFRRAKALELRLGSATPQLVRLGRDMARGPAAGEA